MGDDWYRIKSRAELTALSPKRTTIRIDSIDFYETCGICLKPGEEKFFCQFNLRQLKLRGLTFKRNALNLVVKEVRKQFLKETFKIWSTPELSPKVYKFLFGCNLSETLMYLDLYDQEVEEKSVVLLGKALSSNKVLKKLELGKLVVNPTSSLYPIWMGLNGAEHLDIRYQILLEVDCLFLGRKLLETRFDTGGQTLSSIDGFSTIRNRYSRILIDGRYRLKLIKTDDLFGELQRYLLR